ncbi:50S ribosomal protein L10 [Candidatus Hydrogenisulfobacillus filiaventi]|uniref:Large ribosomal subunit protein uL10 n=1 Tax=Candidatus Hydrogenisulfobacillus filiaventi TaxID=2707344 RepID=A0A6F8ZJL3_9FIRM|nr:50S ribosomal protein L10 [Candidatus Hydrogenisulfobacillus filiaventi]
MPTPAKVAAVAEMREMLTEAQGVVLADFRGLAAHQMNALRNKLRAEQVRLKVVKNTLLGIAAREAGVEGLEPYLEGQTMLAVSTVDPVAPARLMAQAAREYRQVAVKAGILGREVLDAAGVRALADLPSREVLLAQVVGTMAAPIRNLVWTLNEIPAQLVRALDQVRAQREAAAS